MYSSNIENGTIPSSGVETEEIPPLEVEIERKRCPPTFSQIGAVFGILVFGTGFLEWFEERCSMYEHDCPHGNTTTITPLLSISSHRVIFSALMIEGAFHGILFVIHCILNRELAPTTLCHSKCTIPSLQMITLGLAGIAINIFSGIESPAESRTIRVGFILHLLCAIVVVALAAVALYKSVREYKEMTTLQVVRESPDSQNSQPNRTSAPLRQIQTLFSMRSFLQNSQQNRNNTSSNGLMFQNMRTNQSSASTNDSVLQNMRTNQSTVSTNDSILQNIRTNPSSASTNDSILQNIRTNPSSAPTNDSILQNIRTNPSSASTNGSILLPFDSRAARTSSSSTGVSQPPAYRDIDRESGQIDSQGSRLQPRQPQTGRGDGSAPVPRCPPPPYASLDVGSLLNIQPTPDRRSEPCSGQEDHNVPRSPISQPVGGATMELGSQSNQTAPQNVTIATNSHPSSQLGGQNATNSHPSSQLGRQNATNSNSSSRGDRRNNINPNSNSRGSRPNTTNSNSISQQDGQNTTVSNSNSRPGRFAQTSTTSIGSIPELQQPPGVPSDPRQAHGQSSTDYHNSVGGVSTTVESSSSLQRRQSTSQTDEPPPYDEIEDLELRILGATEDESNYLEPHDLQLPSSPPPAYVE